MTEMARRLRAAQGCIDRFSGKAQDSAKKRDCCWLARHTLHLMGRRVGQGKLPTYTTEAAGLRVLRKMGHASLVDLVDSLGLDRLDAPLRALPGDVVALPCPGSEFGAALTVAVGNGRVIGFQNGVGTVMQPRAYLAAWSAL